MGVLVQGVEQGLALARKQGLPVQQSAHGFEGFRLPATAQLHPIKAQQAVLSELGAIEQQPLAQAGEQNPARRAGLAEDLLAQALLPVGCVGCADVFGQRFVAQGFELFGLDGAGERILVRLLAEAGQGFQYP
ncbi:hypothetical protein [Nitrococcus mobilis]|uniref:Uncharacterized protein n=1 Tax=Nitrococcus mobilis Nb-231 TaxID=314278 RepID=A4BL18_9GAMM|nr:hypothetical protein [Nitrococcus mobilis]EAR23006.1 hypothetical protein NB231_14338 [Nitrococcus mobilis Nb-231]